MNVTKPPFNNVKVRQAVAYAIPYEKIMDSAMYKRATKMWGDADNKASGSRLAAGHRLRLRPRQGEAAHEGGRR